MAYDISLCNDKGETLCGSDGNINVDKRFNLSHIHKEVSEYRNRFKKNFLDKFEYWTHFIYRGQIYKI